MKSWGRVAVAYSLVLAYGSGCTSGSDAPSDRLPGAELTPVRTLALEGNGNPLLLAVDDLAVDLAGNLFVLDGKTGRVHKYGPNGDYLASVSGPDGEAAGFRQPSGTGAGSMAFGQDRHLYVAGVVSETVAFHIWPGKYPAGRRRLPLSVVRWRAEGGEIVPVADSVSGSDYYFGPRGVGFGKPPVSEVTSIAAGAGFLFVSEGAPSVRFMDAEGATRMEVAVEGTGVELGGNVRHRVTDSLYALEAINPVRMEKRLESAPLPERADGFDVVVFARDSTLWLGGRGIPGIEHRAWINVDMDGVPLRRLRLPRSLLVMDAEGDRLLLRRRDDMGLHHVEVRRAISP